MPVLPPLDTPETLRAGMNRARITLEPALLDDAQGRYRGAYRITPRAFFAASCGVPSLIESFDGLAEFFEPGLEIAAFTSPEDAVLQAERLLSDETARAAMGRRARQRALRQHTWDRRRGGLSARRAGVEGAPRTAAAALTSWSITGQFPMSAARPRLRPLRPAGGSRSPGVR